MSEPAAALSAEERLLRLLRQHHDHHLTSGPIGLQDGEGGWIEIDNGLEYSESSLYLHTEAALKNAPPPDDAPMPRGGIQAHWWQISILERRKRKVAEQRASALAARLTEVEATLRDLIECEAALIPQCRRNAEAVLAPPRRAAISRDIILTA